MRCPISFHTRRAAIAALFADLTRPKRAQDLSPTTYDAGFEVLRSTGEPVHDVALRHALVTGTPVEAAARIGGGL